MPLKIERQFPVLPCTDRTHGFKRPGGWVPWGLAELAHNNYVAWDKGAQTLEEAAESGGWTWHYLLYLLRDRPGEYPLMPATVEATTATGGAAAG